MVVKLLDLVLVIERLLNRVFDADDTEEIRKYCVELEKVEKKLEKIEKQLVKLSKGE